MILYAFFSIIIVSYLLSAQYQPPFDALLYTEMMERTDIIDQRLHTILLSTILPFQSILEMFKVST